MSDETHAAASRRATALGQPVVSEARRRSRMSGAIARS